MRKLLFLTVAFAWFSAGAQFTVDYLKAADNYFNKKDYSSAAEYYEKFLAGSASKNAEGYKPYVVQKGSKKSVATTESIKQQATYNLAESYRLLNYHVKAEPVYANVLTFEGQAFPLARFHYATTLRALAKFAEAETAFSTFLNEYKTEDKFRESAVREIENLRFIQAQLAKKDLKYYNINKGASTLNSTGANYAPQWLGNDVLMFTTTRPEKETKEPEFTNRIYQAVFTGTEIANVVPVDIDQQKDVHQGVIALTPDRNGMFLTRWVTEGGKKNAALYFSSKNGDKWSDPVALDATINVSGANNQQPFLMSNGKQLLFSSDREGGMGGFDIWVADLDASFKPLSVRNLGPSVNTKFDEQAPYYHEASHALIFASNGRIGMGNYDLFFSKGDINDLSEPQNFGYPVNSIKDDIYFISRGSAKNILEDAMLSSDRDAECCLELYTLSKIRPALQVSGLVVACETGKPLQGVAVSIIDTINNRTIANLTTDTAGRYNYSIEDYIPLKATASIKGYVTNAMEMRAPVDNYTDLYTHPNICLVKPVVVVNNVYYAYNEATLLDSSFASLDNLVQMLTDNPTMEIEIGGHTDNKGSDDYNLKLSEARAQSVVTYIVGKGIDPARIQAKGYGATKPIAPNTIKGKDNPEGRAQNRRTDFRILRY